MLAPPCHFVFTLRLTRLTPNIRHGKHEHDTNGREKVTCRQIVDGNERKPCTVLESINPPTLKSKFKRNLWMPGAHVWSKFYSKRLRRWQSPLARRRVERKNESLLYLHHGGGGGGDQSPGKNRLLDVAERRSRHPRPPQPRPPTPPRLE